MPGAARINPFNTFKAWNAGYLTDQRTFSNSPAASVRMRSLAEIYFDVRSESARLIRADHQTSGTTEVDISSGAQKGFAMADMSRCGWSQLTAPLRTFQVARAFLPFGGIAPIFIAAGTVAGEWEICVVGQAGDPLVSAAADIDYDGVFHISVASFSPPRVTVRLDANIDAFPAFEAYARLDGITKTLFTAPPPPGNTVVDLLGGASRKFRGAVTLP